MLKSLFILVFITGCSHLKMSPPVDALPVEEILKKVSVTGEGKGRLSVKQQQYLFGTEAVFDKGEWVLAVSIPLHGEEVLRLENLRKADMHGPLETFELRIQEALDAKFTGKLSARTITKSLRKLLRLILAPDLELKRECALQSCTLEGETYMVTTTSKSISIESPEQNKVKMTMTASNLTDSFFKKLDFKVNSANNPDEILSLELFWNNT